MLSVWQVAENVRLPGLLRKGHDFSRAVSNTSVRLQPLRFTDDVVNEFFRSLLGR